MPLSSASITYDLSDLVGTDFDPRRIKVWATTNIADETVIDTDGNQIRMGSGSGEVGSDGTGSVSVWVPGSGSNPASWQTTIHVDYPDPKTAKGRKTRSFGPFTIAASADLADLVDQQEIPPAYLTTVTALLDGYVADAEAARDQAVDISNISTSDDVMAAVAADTGSDFYAVQTATLDTEIPPRVGFEIENNESPGAVAVDARIDDKLDDFAGAVDDNVVLIESQGGSLTEPRPLLANGSEYPYRITWSSDMGFPVNFKAGTDKYEVITVTEMPVEPSSAALSPAEDFRAASLSADVDDVITSWAGDEGTYALTGTGVLYKVDANGQPYLEGVAASSHELHTTSGVLIPQTNWQIVIGAMGVVVQGTVSHLFGGQSAVNRHQIATLTAPTPDTFQSAAGGSLNSGVTADSAWHRFYQKFAGASSVFNIDGTEVTGNAGTEQMGGFRLFTDTAGTTFYGGKVKRILVGSGTPDPTALAAFLAQCDAYYTDLGA